MLICMIHTQMPNVIPQRVHNLLNLEWMQKGSQIANCTVVAIFKITPGYVIGLTSMVFLIFLSLYFWFVHTFFIVWIIKSVYKIVAIKNINKFAWSELHFVEIRPTVNVPISKLKEVKRLRERKIERERGVMIFWTKQKIRIQKNTNSVQT